MHAKHTLRLVPCDELSVDTDMDVFGGLCYISLMAERLTPKLGYILQLFGI